MSSRYKTNKKILKKLKKAFKLYPEMRFCQMLWNFNIIQKYTPETSKAGQIVDNFYEESETTLQKLKSIK